MPIFPFTYGYRCAADVLMEVSLHLVEDVVDTTLVYAGPGGWGDGYWGGSSTPPTYGWGDGPPTILLLASTEFLYPGAQFVLGWGLQTAEVVTVAAIQSNGAVIPTAALANSHAPGETILGPTFPTQQTTDPLYTQSEVLGYLARAQNNFLNKASWLLDFSELLLTVGQQYYPAPGTAVELERVAVQPNFDQREIQTIQRAAGIVTATLAADSDFTPGLAILVAGVSDDSFNSVGNAPFTLLSNSLDGRTLTWQQAGSDTSSLPGDGAVLGPPIRKRLYEANQNQVSMRDPNWQSNGLATVPTTWYEDRTGSYTWGVAPLPRGNFYAQVLSSQRGPESLSLLDGFLLPDPFVQYLKYGVLAACLSKDGEQRNPTMARWCQAKFDFGVMLTDRFMRNMIELTGAGTQALLAAAGGS